MPYHGSLISVSFEMDLQTKLVLRTFGSPTLHFQGRILSPQLPSTRMIAQQLLAFNYSPLKAMSSRLVLFPCPLRAVTRSAALAPARCSETSIVQHLNHDTTRFATLNDTPNESSTQVLSLPVLSAAKSLRRQIESAAPLSTSLTCVGVLAKTFEENRKLNKFGEIFVQSEVQRKIARAWEPVERHSWLERFGGPGKTIDVVVGNETVVFREIGEDGNAYLRVLI